MYSLLNRSPLRAPTVLARGVKVKKGHHIRAGEVARSRNVPYDKHGQPIHQVPRKIRNLTFRGWNQAIR